MPTSDALRDYYSHHYRSDYKSAYTPKPKHVFRAGVAAAERVSFLQDFFASRGVEIESMRLLDVGAGGGEVVYAAQKAGFVSCGIEPNIGYSEFARDQYGVTVETGQLDSSKFDRFDVITLFHVLEHVPEPVTFLQKLHEHLQPNGHLLIEVPNIEQADASPHNIYFRAHLLYFSVATLLSLASPGFSSVQISSLGNLRVLFQRKHEWGEMKLPSPADVQHTEERLKQKGWLEYLFSGGGLWKPFKRIDKYWTEQRNIQRNPRDTLDRALSIR